MFCVWYFSSAVFDVISGFVVILVYCDCGCSVFGPYFVKAVLDVITGFVVFLVSCDCGFLCLVLILLSCA